MSKSLARHNQNQIPTYQHILIISENMSLCNTFICNKTILGIYFEPIPLLFKSKIISFIKSYLVNFAKTITHLQLSMNTNVLNHSEKIEYTSVLKLLVLFTKF